MLCYRFDKSLNSDLILYHVVSGVHTLGNMQIKLHPILERYPPIWITKIEEDIYVNNAKILTDRSNFRAMHRLDTYGKDQILHIIDEMLDPIKYSTNAYTLMENWKYWNMAYGIERYRRKVLQSAMHHRYVNNGSSTYLIPIDDVQNDNLINLIDYYVIQGHIIPDMVLFTRPLFRHFPYETLANDGYINVVVIFFEMDDRLYVKSKTIQGDANHPKGEITAEIVMANIPVENGVVHLIRNPLMVIERPMKKFPYLPIFDKISMDPTLNITYMLGEKVKFNEQFKNDKKLYTYFIPRDLAWKKFVERLDLDDMTTIVKNAKSILERHVLVGSELYTMEKLVTLTHKKVNGSYFETLNGGIMMKITKKNDNSYTIMLEDKYIHVYRGNYECTNGIVHIVDDVMVTREELKNYNIYSDNQKMIYTLFNVMKLLQLI